MSSAASSFPAFADLPNLHPTLRRNLEKNFPFSHMTEIQALTWECASQGKDVLGRARTGTGKTVSFLLPALQQLLHKDLDRDLIHMLVLSPTRELASQIHDEAKKLTHANKEGFKQQVIFGGSSKIMDIRGFERNPPSLLVATPGRLLDHLNNTTVRGRPFSELFQKTSVLVLDETDRLLDMGFQRDVSEIIRFLPSKHKRQTLLFSATVPEDVKSVMAQTMKPDFLTADCIHDTDPATHTNEQVTQHHVILPYQEKLTMGPIEIIYKILKENKEKNEPVKLVVFFPTANAVSFYAAAFNDHLKIPVLELHSRKSQSYRTRTADQFRAADEAILFTSDVSARGVDYPGVTHVVQVGIADSRESYIHRLGRTGRAGKKGEGLLILSDLERNFLETLDGIEVPVHEEYQSMLDESTDPGLEKRLERMKKKIDEGSESIARSFENAYRAQLGFYNGKLSKLGNRDPATLVNYVNAFAEQAGRSTFPPVEQKLIRNMGLRYTDGLNIQSHQPREPREFGQQRGSSRSGFSRRENEGSRYEGYSRRGQRGSSRRGQQGFSRREEESPTRRRVSKKQRMDATW